MPRQWNVSVPFQWRTTNFLVLVPACRRKKYAVSGSILRCLVFCLFFMTYWESGSLPSIPDIRRGVNATGGKEFSGRDTPLAEDVRYFLTFAFATAKSHFAISSRPHRLAALPEELAEGYVFKAGARAEQGHGEVTENGLRPPGDPYSGERKFNRSSKPGRHGKVAGPTYFNEAVADDANKRVIDNKVQPLEENQAGTLRRILDMFSRRNSDAAKTESTERTALKSEGAAYARKGIFVKEAAVHRRRLDEQKAGVAANEQRGSDDGANMYNMFDNGAIERMDEKTFSMSYDDANSEGAAEYEKDSRVKKGTPVNGRVPAYTERNAMEKLEEEQIEKIRRGMKFTQKFDFDQACEEARQASTVRLVWNIVYTDELAMAQQLHEKMEAYVLRQYIALLKRERDLQKIRIVGNPQLMRLLRSLLKREHIKTTKTDAEIGKLFAKVPRLFDWIPPFAHVEEQSHTTIPKGSGIDEL